MNIFIGKLFLIYMKKITQMAVIIAAALIIAKLLGVIVISQYAVQKDIVETEQFRNMKISEKTIAAAEKFSKENGINKSRLLACNYLKEDLNLKKRKFTPGEYKKLDYNYKQAGKKEYAKVCTAMEAVFDDLKYFPVAKSSKSDSSWISYEDSFGADRMYNGEYKHEGTDIMAENNVSGYYPVVSVTDGVIENIGWLEKGGYRVGIRSASGGYFYYAHLSSYTDIKKGDKVKAGTLLGYMGDTGYGKAEGTSGNFDVHLHFGIYIKTENFNELSVNPYHILKYLEGSLIAADY